jgi:hypothetical protein
MLFVKKTLPLLLAIFFISVLVRLPQLNRPLSGHHEFCTSVSLRIMQIWYDNGISKYGYNPVMTYNNPADKHINNFANASGKMIDAEGNYYYVSHPPFAYYLPYAIFKILHIRPDVLPIQIFNLFLHFISGLFVYFTVCLLSFKGARNMPFLPAVVAFVAYIFSPPTLWFQGNVYMSDMMVNVIFIIGVYTVLKMISRQKFYSPKYIFFYCLSLTLMIYTSWLGVFFAFGVLVYSLLHVRNVKGYSVLIWTTVVLTVLMLQVIFYQYSQINGVEAYVSELLNRYIQRGSVGRMGNGFGSFLLSYFGMIFKLLYNYLANYFLIYILLIGFLYLAVSKSKLKMVFSENGYRFLWLSVLPVVLLHLVFLNYSVHDFTTLYGALFFSVLLGVFYDKMKRAGNLPVKTLNAIVIVGAILLMVQYTVTNMPGEKSVRGLEYATAQETGVKIATEAKPDEVVFVIGKEANPQVIYYAERNMRYAKSKEDAIAFLKHYGQTKGVLFNMSNNGAELIEHFTAP